MRDQGGRSDSSLLHNHPSGDPKPSRDDIEMTREIRKAAEALGIAIHDHLVIGRKGHASFRSLGCSPDPRFAMHSSSINASR